MTQRFGGIYSMLPLRDYFRLETILLDFEEIYNPGDLEETSVKDLLSMLENIESNSEWYIDNSGPEDYPSTLETRMLLVDTVRLKKKIEKWYKRFGGLDA